MKTPHLFRVLLAGLFLPGFCVAGTAYFPSLQVPRNALNPGYPLHWSAAAAFAVNPVLRGSGDELLFSGSLLPLGFSSFDAILLWGNDKEPWGRRGIQASFFSSESFPEYELDGYYDPQETGELKPFAFDASFGISPLPVLSFLRTGAALRLVYENDGAAKRGALACDAGIQMESPFGLFSLTLRNAGILFFRNTPGRTLPLTLGLGGRKDFALPLGLGDLRLLCGAEGSVTPGLRGLFGVHYVYTYMPEAYLGLLLDASVSHPRSDYDGVTPAVFVETRGKNRILFLYRFRWSGEVLHSIGLGLRT